MGRFRRNYLWHHPFSTYEKFSGKVTVRTCAYQGLRNNSFWEILGYVLNEWFHKQQTNDYPQSLKSLSSRKVDKLENSVKFEDFCCDINDCTHQRSSNTRNVPNQSLFSSKKSPAIFLLRNLCRFHTKNL